MKAVVHNEKGYKADCGFRNHINRCYFKAEDCKEDKCDMYNLDWDKKTIKNQIDIEKKELLKLEKESKLDSVSSKQKKEFKKLIDDKKIGLSILAEALYFLRFGNFIEFKHLQRLARNFFKEFKE